MEHISIPTHIAKQMLSCVIENYPAVLQSGRTASEAMQDMIRAYRLAFDESEGFKTVQAQTSGSQLQAEQPHE